jgi:hypothetical protein
MSIGRLWSFDFLDSLYFAFTCIDADGFAQDITWLDSLFLILMLITPFLVLFTSFSCLFLSFAVFQVLYPYTPCRNKIAVIFLFLRNSNTICIVHALSSLLHFCLPRLLIRTCCRNTVATDCLNELCASFIIVDSTKSIVITAGLAL